MKSCEKFVAPSSDYYNYTPTVACRNAFFYPICTGHFIYEPGYHQHRNLYDSFLLMYIQSGKLIVNMEYHSQETDSGHFVLLDCYRPHGYRTDYGYECLWIHFDGPVARAWYEMIVSHLGNIFSIYDPYPVLNKMMKIYHTFSGGETIREALISKQITDILTSLILYTPLKTNSHSQANSMEEIISYINEHFMEEVTVDALAKLAMLSPYHFIRTFKKETGFTPHEYLINTRITAARYMLRTTRMSIKDICFQTGFSCESVFCTSFKKNTRLTPAEYRKQSASTACT